MKESHPARDESSIKVEASKPVTQIPEDHANREVKHVGQLEEEEEKVPMRSQPHPETPSAAEFG